MLLFEILSPAKAGQGLEKAGQWLFPLNNPDKSLTPHLSGSTTQGCENSKGPAFSGQTPEKAGLSRKSLTLPKNVPPPC
jgi:hypothetical protein